MKKQFAAGKIVLFRYLITNFLILIIPLVIAVVYYLVSVNSIEKSINDIAELQLRADVEYVDRKLKDLKEQTDRLLVNYELNRYLNNDSRFTDIDLYNSKRISERILALIIGGEFLSRGFIYMSNSDRVIADNGFSEYSLFYGPLFQVKGYDSEAWKSVMLAQYNQSGEIRLGFQSSEEGKSHSSHLYIQPIGTGNFFRGDFVAVINAELLGQRLTKLPELYGGWLFVTDGSGNIVASSSPGESSSILRAISADQEGTSLQFSEQNYRIYSQKSEFNGWQYTALLNDSSIRNDLIKVRNWALYLLLAAFIVGAFLCYLMAFTNSRPLTRLFSLLKISSQESAMQFAAVYTRLEQSILKLSDAKQELEMEVKSATVTTQTYFLQNLLRGEYQDRALLAEDRDRFEVVLASSFHFVIVCSLSPLALALDTRDHGEVMTALHLKLQENIMRDEYALRASAGALAIILRVKTAAGYRTVAESFIAKVLSEFVQNLKEHVFFGIGEPVNEPFLLPMSFNEAEAANLSIGPEQRNPVVYYKDLPASEFTYSYPFHVEESICKAIRSSNIELLSSIYTSLCQENLTRRSLSQQEIKHLVIALRGTAVRLLNEFPCEFTLFNDDLNGVINSYEPEKALESMRNILTRMARTREQGKRSHNANLAQNIREFILADFRDFSLGLTSIAEEFNLSENYLSSFFKEQEGEGLSNYIQRIRMTEASTLLSIHQDLSIDTIAANCGYPNTSSFRRAFKRVYGISPSEYRTADNNHRHD